MNTDLENAYFLQNKISEWLKCIINLLYSINFLKTKSWPWNLGFRDHGLASIMGGIRSPD